MRFKDVAGMHREKEHLRRMVDEGRIPHALLLHGKAGIGKMQLARALAQYVNCTNRTAEGDSCGECAACKQTGNLNHPDVHFIYPIVKHGNSSAVSLDYIEEWREMLSKYPYMQREKWQELLQAGNSQPQIQVTEAMEIIRQSSLSSYSAKYKIFIIWQPEKMNLETANKLLKMIEEPYEDTLFFMVSNEENNLIPTVRSRLQAIKINGQTEKEIAEWLMRKYGIDPVEAANIARIVDGDIAKAEELCEFKGEISDFPNLFIETTRTAYSKNVSGIKNLAEKFASFGREKSMRLLQYFNRMVRENFIYNLHVDSLTAMTKEEEAFSKKFSPFISYHNIEKISEAIDKAISDIGRNANQKIVWFDFMLQLMIFLRLKK